MKKMIRFAAFALMVTTTLVACKKDKDTEPGKNQATACDGKNFCMKVDGTQITKDAKWKTLPDGRTRIIWEEGSGNNYKNVEMDIYGTATGTYTVVAKPSTGQAGFQYFVNDNGTSTNIQGQSGTVEVTSTANNTYTGKFTVTGTDNSGKTYQITEGNFVNVPQ